MQASSVCKRFAQAAGLVRFSVNFPQPGDEFEDGDTRPLPCSYDSKLLLSWAPASLWGIEVDLDTASAQGLLALIQASKHLGSMTLRGSSAAAHGCADKLILAAPSTLVWLECHDSMVPTAFPPLLEAVCLDLENVDMSRKEILFQRLSRLNKLWDLSCSLGSQPLLPTSVCLPSSLHVHFWMSVNDESEVQLEWLTLQAFKELGLEVHMHTEDMYQHHDVLVQLAGPAISQLSITMHVPFTEPLQALWGQVQGISDVFLHIQSPPGPLPAPMIADLPISKYLSLDLACGTRQDIAWAALCQCACSIRIKLETSQTLCIHGCPGTMLEDIGGPWRLQIYCDEPGSILGLPEPHVKHCPDFDQVRCRYRNAAAAASGSPWY